MEENYDKTVGDEEDDLRLCLERARKIRLNKPVACGLPQAIALLANSSGEIISPDVSSLEPQHKHKHKLVVFTELQGFVAALHPLHQDSHKPKAEDEALKASVEEHKARDGSGCATMQDSHKDEPPPKEKEKNRALDQTLMREVADGKGLFATLNRLKDRGELVCCRQLDPKEEYRQLSHKFHGKGPGKKKQEKRLRKHQEELKSKNMNADASSSVMEKVREIHAQLKTPYINRMIISFYIL